MPPKPKYPHQLYDNIEDNINLFKTLMEEEGAASAYDIRDIVYKGLSIKKVEEVLIEMLQRGIIENRIVDYSSEYYDEDSGIAIRHPIYRLFLKDTVSFNISKFAKLETGESLAERWTHAAEQRWLHVQY